MTDKPVAVGRGREGKGNVSRKRWLNHSHYGFPVVLNLDVKSCTKPKFR